MVRKLALLMLLALSGCSWWGEAAPPAQVVKLAPDTGPACADISRILEGGEAESSAALECWAGQADKIWSEVEGAKKDELTLSEAQTLIRKQSLQMPFTPEAGVAKAGAFFKLLGFGTKLTRPEVNSWLDWARANRVQARSLWLRNKALESDYGQFTAADLQSAANLIASFVAQARWDSGPAGAMSFDALHAELATLVALPSSVESRLDGLRTLLGYDGKLSVASLLTRHLEWISAQANEIAAVTRDPGADLARSATLLSGFLGVTNWAPTVTVENLVAQAAQVFGLSGAEVARVGKIQELLNARGPNALTVLKSRALWVSAHWADLTQVATRLSPANLVKDPAAVNAAQTLASLAREAHWPDTADFETLEADALEFVTVDPALLRTINAAREMVGLQGTFVSPKVIARAEWIESNWAELNAVYLRFTQGTDTLKYSDIERAGKLASDFLGRLDLRMTTEHLAKNIQDIVQATDPLAVRSILPGARLALNLVAMVCPGVQDLDTWYTPEIARCAARIPEQFKPGSDWVEWTLDPTDRIPTPERKQRILDALTALQQALQSYTDDPTLKPLQTKNIIDFAAAIGAKPPADFAASFGIITRFNSKSTGDRIDPSALAWFFRNMREFEVKLLDGVPFFAKAAQKNTCINLDAKRWSDCVPQLTAEDLKAYPTINYFSQIKNFNYGGTAVPRDGDHFRRAMIFDTVSAEVVRVFQTAGKQVITSNGSADDDQVVLAITLGVNAYDLTRRLIDNFNRKLSGQPLLETDPASSIFQYNMRGLARLLTMLGTDVLVHRPTDERNQLEKVTVGLLSNLEVAPRASVALDQKALSAILVVVDGLGDFHDHYLKQLKPGLLNLWQKRDEQGQDMYIGRDYVVSRLPDLLLAHFPRTAESCKEFGYERSCGIVFDEALPRRDDEPGMLSVSDLDVITLAGEIAEGVLDSCDSNGDERLSLRLFDGNDELTCATKRFADITSRLIAAKIITPDHGTGLQALLDVLKFAEATRVFGKIPLIDGTLKNVGWSPLEVPVRLAEADSHPERASASLGSIFGLVADIMDPTRARAAAIPPAHRQ